MKSTLFLLLILVVCSCKKKITIDIPNEANKPVLNLLMSRDSLMLARLTVSGHIGNGALFPEIRNAVVKLYENGVFKEKMDTVVKGIYTYYKSTVTAKAGATYRIVAAIPGFPEVEGSDFVPEGVATGEISVKSIAAGSQIKGNVTVELHDKKGEKNYYRIRIYGLSKDYQGHYNKWPHKFASGDPKDGLFNNKDRTEFFTDDVWFDGHSPRFSFLTYWYNPRDKIIVEISTLTYSSYTYLFTAFMAHEKNDDPLSEKVIIFNNINNGLGIVGGLTEQEYIIGE
ncbi:DUF4249 domain-containing protein [Chitinophaga sp. RAB17]|uniref:DUF4249 domain-containing protein n=1 Tax=Chitinophaga sp. RAB17 TaxID=3233049 RepID=UPI003F8D9A50